MIERDACNEVPESSNAGRYLQSEVESAGYEIETIGNTFIIPLNVYSQKISSVEELKDGDVAVIPVDLTNGGRVLKVLEAAGLITIRQPAGFNSLRREFHRHPEVSMKEDWTCGRICQELSALGIPYEIAGERNVIGRLEFGKGRRIAFRADFDALLVEEALDVLWKSQRENVMHACGHDGHTAALLGAARLLRSAGERMRGTVYHCFRQGEEVGQGAHECVEYLKRNGGVDMGINAHPVPVFETGTIDVDPGLRAKGADYFRIDITGKGGHGSRPDLVPNVLYISI